MWNVSARHWKPKNTNHLCRAGERACQHNGDQVRNGVHHCQQQLLRAEDSQRPAPYAPPQGENDQVCTASSLSNQHSGLEHPDRCLLHCVDQPADPRLCDRPGVLELPARKQLALEEALLQRNLLRVRCGSASLLPKDRLRDRGRPIRRSETTTGQTCAGAVPSGQDVAEFI